MNFPLNLTKLSDAELAEQLGAAWSRYDAAGTRLRQSWWSKFVSPWYPPLYRLWVTSSGSVVLLGQIENITREMKRRVEERKGARQ